MRSSTLATVLVSIVAGLSVRGAYALLDVEDFWGDSYHHWLISRLTAQQGWVLSDFKGTGHVWLPFYHYFIAGVMRLFGRYDLFPSHVCVFRPIPITDSGASRSVILEEADQRSFA